MGHANVDTTINVYTRVLDASVRDAVERVGNQLNEIERSARNSASATTPTEQIAWERLVRPARFEHARAERSEARLELDSARRAYPNEVGMVRPARFEHARAERSEARLELDSARRAYPNEVGMVRPARFERATSWFVARQNEATGGGSRQLPQVFPADLTARDHSWRLEAILVCLPFVSRAELYRQRFRAPF